MYLNISAIKTTGMHKKKKKCLWLGESGKIEEEGYRELFERVGTGGLFSPGKMFLEGNKENHTYCEQT